MTMPAFVRTNPGRIGTMRMRRAWRGGTDIDFIDAARCTRLTLAGTAAVLHRTHHGIVLAGDRGNRRETFVERHALAGEGQTRCAQDCSKGQVLEHGTLPLRVAFWTGSSYHVFRRQPPVPGIRSEVAP